MHARETGDGVVAHPQTTRTKVFAAGRDTLQCQQNLHPLFIPSTAINTENITSITDATQPSINNYQPLKWSSAWEKSTASAAKSAAVPLETFTWVPI